jgi:hypothetical protein
MLFITGIPLVFMELSLGQYCSSGIVTLWKLSPIFQGNTILDTEIKLMGVEMHFFN